MSHNTSLSVDQDLVAPATAPRGGRPSMGAPKWMARGVAAAAMATALTATVAASPAAAHTSDDWVAGSMCLSHLHRPTSEIEGGRVEAYIYWKDNLMHAYDAYVTDTKKDGLTPVAQIRYRVHYKGKWHWHYRYVARAARGAGDTAVVHQHSRHAIQDLHIRIVLMKGNKVVRKDPEFR